SPSPVSAPVKPAPLRSDATEFRRNMIMTGFKIPLKAAGGAALAALLLALPALGQDATAPVEAVEVAAGEGVSVDVVFILNSLLMILGGILVFFMAAGFAMVEAGMVRTKNTSMQLLKNISLFAIACIMYYLVGYNLMYPLGAWSIG